MKACSLLIYFLLAILPSHLPAEAEPFSIEVVPAARPQGIASFEAGKGSRYSFYVLATNETEETQRW
jgi:hypothetical protein